MMTEAFLCFTLWCLFGTAPENQNVRPPITMSVVRDTISPDGFKERALFVEQYRLIGGFVEGREGVTVAAGYFPLRLRLGPAHLDAGASLATSPIPEGGTSANWTVRLNIKPAKWVGVTWLHFSNARSVIPNPSSDMLGVSFTW